MTNRAAAWHPDPYGRFAKRYWDGNGWTEHVVTGQGDQQVDPMGTSTVTPIAIPPTAQGRGQTTAGGASAGRSPWPPPDPSTVRR